MYNKSGKITKKFGLKLKMERHKRSLSQEKLAELANVGKNTIGAIERGENSPSLETIATLAKALKMEITDLININKFEL